MDGSDTVSLAGQPELWVALAVAVALVAAITTWLVRRRSAKGPATRLREVTEDLVTGFLVPSAESGHIHIDYALLTRREILILDIRDVAGHVFGSETMHEWTVLDARRRLTFPNPLPLLYDRVAAVRRLVPEVPVRGCVAFTGRAKFSKGFPPHVVMLDPFIEDLRTERANPAANPSHDALRLAWTSLRDVAAGGSPGQSAGARR